MTATLTVPEMAPSIFWMGSSYFPDGHDQAAAYKGIVQMPKHTYLLTTHLLLTSYSTPRHYHAPSTYSKTIHPPPIHLVHLVFLLFHPAPTSLYTHFLRLVLFDKATPQTSPRSIPFRSQTSDIRRICPCAHTYFSSTASTSSASFQPRWLWLAIRPYPSRGCRFGQGERKGTWRDRRR